MGFVVTIDGPAGAGKSTAARELARRLGWRYLDTGALYRAVALLALERGISADDGPALGRLAAGLALRQDREGRTWVGDRDVSREIRAEEVSAAASPVSAHPEVRSALVEVQRRAAEDGDLVCEGRDMGSVIFPAAELKIYLDAEGRTRARRRLGDLRARGDGMDLDEMCARLEARDRRDAERTAAPLRRSRDQVPLDTTNMTIEQVVDHLQALVADRLRSGIPPQVE